MIIHKRRPLQYPCIAMMQTFLVLFVWGSPALQAQTKLVGGGFLFRDFVYQDRTWYQDAMQAYHGLDMMGSDGPESKADFSLVLTAHQWAHHLLVAPEQPYVCFDRTLVIKGDQVLVDITCHDESGVPKINAFFTGSDASEPVWAGHMGSVWLAHNRIGPLSILPEVRMIRPAYHSSSSGLTASQGDLALRADAARATAPGYWGEGITIGTLSDSFDRASDPCTSSVEDVSNNDLPKGILILEEFNGNGSDEGRAMMQIIHDIAPGANQMFHTAFNGQADFANGVRALATAGCSIIVDDIFYFAEPFYQDGVIAQAVNDVARQGVAYFSAAGNSGRKSYEGPCRLTTQRGLSDGFLHDFDPNEDVVDVFLEVTIPLGETVSFVFQWDEPFFSVSGSPGCASDLDLLLSGAGEGQFRVLAASLANNIGGDPVEILSFTNTGSIDVDGVPGFDTRFNLIIELFSGPEPQIMKFIYFDEGGVALSEYATDSATLVGHANATGAMAVAAAPYFNTPSFGVSPALPEPFSSPGGTPLLFDREGQRLAEPLLTGQPRFTAPDGGNTTFFGVDLNASFPSEEDTYPNFFGTSAAAPHAAAAAALVLQKAGGPGSLGPVALSSVLQETASDMGAPGFDLETGAGLINVEAAMTIIASMPGH